MVRLFTLCCLLLLGASSLLTAQIIPTNQDCLGAIPICQQIYVEDQSPSGDGNYNNEINTSISCTAGELNSIWYRFTVNQDGNFGFLIIPNDPDDDYDWALFDITNASCEDIVSDASLVVSCNAAGGVGCHGPTGADGSSIWSVQGAGCNSPTPSQFAGNSPLNAFIPVFQGNSYVLMVSNWSGSPNGYTIDFGLSTGIDIFDDTPPLLENAELPTACDQNTITLEFDEVIDCSTVSADGFQLVGPGGPYNVAISSVICDGGGSYDNSFELLIDPPISSLGDFTLSLDMNTTLSDPCGNFAEPFSLDFTVDDPSELIIDLGASPLELCEGDTLLLDATLANGSYVWQDGSTGSTLEVTQGGQYAVQVTNFCGTGTDTVEVLLIETPPDIDLGIDTLLCTGDTLFLDSGINNADYLWQNGSTEPTFTVFREGTYSVTITSQCNTYEDDRIVNYIPPISFSLPLDTFYCESQIFLNAISPGLAFYQWQDGSESPVYLVEAPGNYTVNVFNVCESIAATVEVKPCEVCDIYFPNIFTPNFDGLNDYFRPFSDCMLDNYHFRIYNRWGGLVFESRNPSDQWDGTFRGKAVPMDTYVWSLSCEVTENGIPRTIEAAGDVAVIR
jgi:gliding motility-associated-like protein